MAESRPPPAVDNSDWLKAGAIMMVAIGHTGYFFIDDAAWWSVFGRMAAPVFFFLMGYARSRRIPLKWLWLGLALTLLDSWNNGWDWMPLNILINLALIRLLRPYGLSLLRRYGWVFLIILTAVFIALLPVAGEAFDYGTEGWLWALFGLCQRQFVDPEPADDAAGIRWKTASLGPLFSPDWQRMRLLAAPVAATIYLWQEQLEFRFSDQQLAVVCLGVSVLTLCLFLFVRGPSRLQPREPFARGLRFLGHHTLEIYVVQLAGSEILIGVFPGLAA